MSKQSDPSGFGKFVPGFDFLQQLAQGGNASLASWVAPTLDAQALDKRIEELKTVQFWLDQNATALKATIQALEVQKMTLATLKTMNVPMPMAAPAAAEPARSAARPKAADKASEASAAMPDPLQFWGALTRQFQQIAAGAMQDVARRSTAAPAAAPNKETAPKPARKTRPRSRKQA
jgi:hypothetical protein